jgi:hypothetical protein
MVDMIVNRRVMKPTLARLLRHMLGLPEPVESSAASGNANGGTANGGTANGGTAGGSTG